MQEQGHKCPVGSCTNWVQFDDEYVCFEHTPPVSPGGCNCEGCKPPLTAAQRQRELDILFGRIRIGSPPR